MKWTHKSQIASILVNSDSETAKLEIWADLKSPLSENWHIRNLENIANKTVKSNLQKAKVATYTRASGHLSKTDIF